MNKFSFIYSREIVKFNRLGLPGEQAAGSSRQRYGGRASHVASGNGESLWNVLSAEKDTVE